MVKWVEQDQIWIRLQGNVQVISAEEYQEKEDMAEKESGFPFMKETLLFRHGHKSTASKCTAQRTYGRSIYVARNDGLPVIMQHWRRWGSPAFVKVGCAFFKIPTDSSISVVLAGRDEVTIVFEGDGGSEELCMWIEQVQSLKQPQEQELWKYYREYLQHRKDHPSSNSELREKEKQLEAKEQALAIERKILEEAKRLSKRDDDRYEDALKAFDDMYEGESFAKQSSYGARSRRSSRRVTSQPPPPSPVSSTFSPPPSVSQEERGSDGKNPDIMKIEKVLGKDD